jgi:putative transposase
MKFGFIAKHRNIWPVAWLCEAMGVSRSGFHAWLNRSPSARSRSDETVGQQVKASFVASDRTYGARRVWRDLLADGVDCGLHRIERLMRLQALRARPRRRRLPKDEGDRQIANVPANLLDRQFAAERPNQKWIADFTYIWTAEGWLYVSAVIDLFSRRVVGWSMSSSMTAQLVADALLMAVWRRGNPQFVFSSGQRRAAGLAFLLSVHLARPWSRWETLMLDDPVQHIDDFRALQLVEVLSSFRQAGRQVVVAVEDEALADLLCRRMLSTPEQAGRRYTIDFNERGAANVTARLDVPPMAPGILRQFDGVQATA